MTSPSLAGSEASKPLLIITWSFPPQTGGASHRPAKFAKYLLQWGYRPIILTAKHDSSAHDPSLLRDIPEDISIERTFSFEPVELFHALKLRSSKLPFLYLLLHPFLKLYSILYYRLVIPDETAGWLPLAYVAAKRIIRKHSPETVYVHAPPFSSFLIGYLLKKRYPIRLVVDYDDPWTTVEHYFPGGKIRNKIAASLEKAVLRQADQIVCCKPTISDSILTTWTIIPRGKCTFIPNGYDPDDYLVPKAPRNGKMIRIVYTGKLRTNYCYSPYSFFIALRCLLNHDARAADFIEVVMAGLIAEEYRELIASLQLEKVVRHLGQLSHAESVSLLKSADLLLFIVESNHGKDVSAKYAGSIPAKLFEYLYTGKPILAITPPGFEVELLKAARTGFFAKPNDPEDIHEQLSALYFRFLDKSLQIDPDWDLIGNYDRRVLTGKLAETFSDRRKDT